MNDWRDARKALVALGLMTQEGWHPDVTAQIPAAYLGEMQRADHCSVVITDRVTYFHSDVPDDGLDDLFSKAELLLEMTGAVHPICIWKTDDPEMEQCFQFKSGHVLLFIHGRSFEPPHAGFFHEFVHGLGLTGVSVLDEGLATLFERACESGALIWDKSPCFRPEFLAATERTRPPRVDPYSYGARFFAAVASDKGETALWSERGRLVTLGDETTIYNAISDYLTQRQSDGGVADSFAGDVLSGDTLNRMYFAARFDDFVPKAMVYFSAADILAMPEDDQLIYGRLAGYLATLENSEKKRLGVCALPELDVEMLCGNAQILIKIADVLAEVRQSVSRQSLKKHAGRFKEYLVSNLNNSVLRADILIQLVRFHQFIPEIAGGDRLCARTYALELSECPGMQDVGSRLLENMEDWG